MQSFWSIWEDKGPFVHSEAPCSSQDRGQVKKETAEVGWRRGCRGRQVLNGRGSRLTICVLKAHHRLHTDHIWGSHSLRVLKERESQLSEDMKLKVGSLSRGPHSRITK